MELFVTDDELNLGQNCLKAMPGRPNAISIVDYNINVAKGMVQTMCYMQGKLVPDDLPPLIGFIDNLCCSILGTDNYYIYAAHPTIENTILTCHKGSTLLGQSMRPSGAIMQVYREKNGLCWYISDKPFESHTLKPFSIYNQGSGYFEYYGPSSPIGSDYYIDEFKEW